MTRLGEQRSSRRAASRMLGAAALALGLVGFGGQAGAADFDAEKHFQGRTISFIIDFKPGGGTDTQARYFAKEWGKFIPGNPRVIVRNLVPNPAGRTFVQKSKPDGMTLSFLASLSIGWELTDDSVPFSTKDWQFIGSHAARDLVMFATDKVPYKTLKDAAGGSETIFFVERIGRPEDITARHMGIMLAHDWLGAPLQILPIAGSGTTPTLLALERGDANAMLIGTSWYATPRRRPGWLKTGFLKPMANFGNPDLELAHNGEVGPDIPHIRSWLSPEQREIWDGIVLPEVLAGKTIVAHGDTPPEIVAVLRDAYVAAAQDEDFRKGLEKLQRQPLDLYRGEKLQAAVQKTHAAFEAQLPTFVKLQTEMYDKYVKGR